MKKILFNAVALYGCLFTAITLLSSTLMLLRGESHDAHAHILLRAGFVLIATATMVIFMYYKPKNRLLNYAIPYFVAQSLVFLVVFITGTFTSLHPNAYRDAFLNFSSVALVVIIILIIIDTKKLKKRSFKS